MLGALSVTVSVGDPTICRPKLLTPAEMVVVAPLTVEVVAAPVVMLTAMRVETPAADNWLFM